MCLSCVYHVFIMCLSCVYHVLTSDNCWRFLNVWYINTYKLIIFIRMFDCHGSVPDSWHMGETVGMRYLSLSLSIYLYITCVYRYIRILILTIIYSYINHIYIYKFICQKHVIKNSCCCLSFSVVFLFFRHGSWCFVAFGRHRLAHPLAQRPRAHTR